MLVHHQATTLAPGAAFISQLSVQERRGAHRAQESLRQEKGKAVVDLDIWPIIVMIVCAQPRLPLEATGPVHLFSS